jgi:sigma-B regulation protein RsbU (phosphoserine phosphatase)
MVENEKQAGRNSMHSKKNLTFSAQIDQLHPMLDWIRQGLIAAGFDSKAACRVELASEEILVNIIHHAYKGTSGTIEIGIRIIPKDRIEIEIKDLGPPFNPLEEKKALDLNASLDERKEGGLGIYFVRNIMDEIRYLRQGEANFLTLVKFIRSSQKK